MSRGKAISVKIPTQRVITALETKFAELETNWANQEANEAKYQKSFEKWKKELIDYAVEHIKKAENFRTNAIANIDKAENVGTNYRNWNNNLNVDFDLTVKESAFPAEPVKEYPTIHQHTYNEQKEEISNAIRILKMTDEEVVNTSTYNAVARYL